MIIRYNKFDPEVRDRIRALESKGHIGYIRYLLMRRWTFKDINSELMRLGLSGADDNDLQLYFQNVLFPLIQEHKLSFYYKLYYDRVYDTRLNFSGTFQRSETDRQNFCQCIVLMEIDFFFHTEALEFYGTRDSIPVDTATEKPILNIGSLPNLTEVLNHNRRHMIEIMLIDGKTPKMISDYLDHTYDTQIDPKEILFFANGFFKTKRRDLERTIDDLNEEIARLELNLKKLRDMGEDDMSLGERTTAIAATKLKIEQFTTQVKRLMGNHSHAAYNVGVLESANIREMFADVLVRSHRRYVDMDTRSEDEVIDGMSKIVGMMSKSAERIMNLEDRMSATTKKTISEEMLEVVVPSLERVLKEEQEAFREFQKEFGGGIDKDISDEETEILGLDEE